MDDVPLDPVTLPTIAAGPVLRRVTSTRASVWLALTRGDSVRLHVRRAGTPGPEVASPPTTPLQVGVRLWLVVLSCGAPGGRYEAGKLYEYRVSGSGLGWEEPEWSELAFGTERPAFPGPPSSVADLAVLHTSCRKAHGGGRDALAAAGDVIDERLDLGTRNARPHLLLLSGDQIYADEVAAALAPRVRRVAADLIGIDESAVFPTVPVAGRQAPSEGFGLTSSAASDHLWSLGEYLASYLLYWSDGLWPDAAPSWGEAEDVVDPASGLDHDAWGEQVSRIGTFHDGLPTVRRVLATVPSLMVADDHEVTDDWNIDYGWAKHVHAHPAAGRLVHNGLLAYALCQQWGNDPERFATPGTPEAAVLDAAAYTGGSPDTPALRALLGMPTAPLPAPPTVLRDPAVGLRYGFRLGHGDGWPVRVIALDERTLRAFPTVRGRAARISMDGLAAMLPGPEYRPDPAGATLVVAPSPALGTHVIEHVVQPLASMVPGGAEFADFESWSGSPAHHQELLRRLAAYQPLVVLSGDVHYGTTGSLVYTRDGTTTRAALVTSSSAKNAEPKTILLHTAGELAMQLGIERVRRIDGFDGLSQAQQDALMLPPTAPDAELPYDELVDVLLGRVLRAGREEPALLAHDVATAYGLTDPDWTYEITPVDDEGLPASEALLADMTQAPEPWPGWDTTKSLRMVRALRAANLHRIGRMFVGLPQFSLLTFTPGPLTVHHDLISPIGEDSAQTARNVNRTAVVLT